MAALPDLDLNSPDTYQQLLIREAILAEKKKRPQEKTIYTDNLAKNLNMHLAVVEKIRNDTRITLSQHDAKKLQKESVALRLMYDTTKAVIAERKKRFGTHQSIKELTPDEQNDEQNFLAQIEAVKPKCAYKKQMLSHTNPIVRIIAAMDALPPSLPCLTSAHFFSRIEKPKFKLTLWD